MKRLNKSFNLSFECTASSSQSDMSIKVCICIADDVETWENNRFPFMYRLKRCWNIFEGCRLNKVLWLNYFTTVQQKCFSLITFSKVYVDLKLDEMWWWTVVPELYIFELHDAPRGCYFCRTLRTTFEDAFLFLNCARKRKPVPKEIAKPLKSSRPRQTKL